MKKVLCIIIAVLLALILAVSGVYGYNWYRDSHIFVDDAVYPKDAVSLDLRGQDISAEHFDAVHALLPDCEILWDVPFQGGSYPSDTASLTVTALTEEDVACLDYFTCLETVEASGCRDYAQLAALRERHPGCQVSYQVDLGGVSVDPDTAELTLASGDYDIDTLMENLGYLSQLQHVELKMPELSLAQIDALKAAYEGVEIICSVELLGMEYDFRTTALDLSALTSGEVTEVGEKLSLLPNLTSVELMDAEGKSALTMEDVKALQTAAPEAAFHYSFDFYGVTVSTTDEEVKIANKRIGDDGEADVRLALDLMENCSRFILDNCHLSNEVMAQIRDDYRDQTKVVWRVWFGAGSALTDVEVIRCTYDLSNSNCHDLIYCEDVRFMDIGHNEETYLQDCSFVAGMPNLEAIILSGAPIEDLSGFANCKKLKFLETAFCNYLTDISPLAGCESLEMLNISYTRVTDLSALDELNMTHLCAKYEGKSRIPEEEQERFNELHPDCWSLYVGVQPYGPGWRYTEDGSEYLDYYAMLREVFRYDASVIPNNCGWYLD